MTGFCRQLSLDAVRWISPRESRGRWLLPCRAAHIRVRPTDFHQEVMAFEPRPENGGAAEVPPFAEQAVICAPCPGKMLAAFY
jgi:hypothetical protein